MTEDEKKHMALVLATMFFAGRLREMSSLPEDVYNKCHILARMYKDNKYIWGQDFVEEAEGLLVQHLSGMLDVCLKEGGE